MLISHYSILILEDSPEDRALYRSYLKQDTTATYDVVEVETGLEAWSYLGQNQPDLILIDYRLPDIDGLELLNKLRLKFDIFQLPAMMLTGLLDSAIAAQAIKSGACDYLIKEKLTQTGFCRAIHTVLEKTQLKRQIQMQEQQKLLLAQMLLRIRQFLRLEKILATAVQEVREFLGADRVIVYQFDCENNGKISAESVLPPWKSALNHHINDPCFRESQILAYGDGKIRAISDIHDAEFTACHIELLEQLAVKANLVVPILLNTEAQNQGDPTNQLWGLLIAHQCSNTRQWQTNELDLLQQLAVQLAVGIQQAELYEKLQNLNKSLEQKVKERTEQLQASEQRFRAIFNHSFQFAGLLTTAGIVLEVNQTALDFRGLQLEDVINRPLWEINWLTVAPTEENNLKQAIALAAQGEFIRYEVEILNADNQIVTIDFSIRPVKDESGKVIMLIPEGRDISEHKKAQKALQENQILLQVVMDSLPIAIFWKDRNCRYMGCNRQLLLDSGHSSIQEIIGKTDFEMVWREQAALYQADDRLVMESGQPKFNIEEPLTKVGNLHRWLRTNKIPLHNAEGEIIGVVASYEDITERKEIEQALQESERRYATLAASAPVGIYRADAQGNCLYVNERWCQETGLTRQEALGCGWLVALHPEDRELVESQWHRLIQTGERLCLEYRFVQLDGSETWVFGQAVPETDPEGKVIGYLGTITNITPSKQAEVALRRSQQLYRTLVDNFPNGTVALFDHDLRYLLIGGLELARSGLSKATMEGKTIWEIFPPEVCETFVPLFQKALAGESAIAEVPDQDKFYLIHHIPVRDEQGNVIAGIVMTQNITERKKSENALRDSEEKFRQFAENSRQVMLLRQVDSGELLYANLTYEQVWGRPRESLYANPDSWMAAMHPDDVPRIAAAYETARGKGFFSEEYRIIRPDGSIRWVWGRCFPIKDMAGNIYRIGAIGEDITERKQTEQERDRLLEILEQQNQTLEEEVTQRTAELRAIIDAIPDYLFVIDRQDMRIIYCNDSFAQELFQQPHEQIEGKTLFELFPDQKLEYFVQKNQQVFNSGKLLRIQETLNFLGRINTFDTIKVPLKRDNGEVYALVGTARNITAIKQLELELQHSKERFQNLVETSSDCVWETNEFGYYTYVSPQIINLLGYSPEEFIGKTPFDLMPQAEAQRVSQELIKFISLQVPFQCLENTNYHKDGRLVTLETSGVPIFDANKEFRGYRGMDRDVTARKLAEAQLYLTNEQLATSNTELARATRLKDEFLANMSHELRTPLNAILGMSEVLQDEILGTINDRQRQSLQTIERSGEHLLELINDILDLSKIEAGQLQLEYAPIAMRKLCESSLAFIKQQAGQKRIQLEVKIPPQLPKLLLDERRIRQVLINLLNNAVKFTPEGGRITLEVSRQQLIPEVENISLTSFIRIAIIDTGIGIAPENIKKLFKPFIQIDSALNRQYTGTGLGLALAKRIVELHSGKVGVSSELGVGSCFTVDLPCSNLWESSFEPVNSSPELNSTCEETVVDSPLILLVEDNEANVLTISSYLQAKGYKIILANNGQDAIALTKTRLPDLILMDIQMPGMDGIDAIKQIRLEQNFVNIPIIALTALAMPGDREKCLAAGANDYIPKPIKLNQLTTRIQKLLEVKD
ncbi:MULTISPECIES: PAS domain S-box protein [unclassified Tolypothrix]|uniref:PAS domain S-box protein n=1 Tax=unclassified Tolypothrix TaxID=2649714 RepID=UPI0005EAABCA|nr:MULTISPECIES: PAS domain S-box protein [unclassified Tolypothrix]BAY89104.1 two-component hybrid sensor and regulator [Microchaete diplosiphon NIES-3275]EKF06268.1 sensor histidine kinase [Tolypothrix sp. PCC 7601]MBE9087482.1 PAS domain S-box protein [Tolypothrix sp. LEGE 11397]UYD29725.1 PAS domain S-box protein [Tolypothrix sp. PCC 7712]UYD34358.1 PAS domain S-box protein [Tolypothrix sp. PCC 7601]